MNKHKARRVFDKLNSRRHELISKKFGDGLTERERRVYHYLQDRELLNMLLEDHVPGCKMDFRPLIKQLTELKLWRRKMWPKGQNYPGYKVAVSGGGG